MSKHRCKIVVKIELVHTHKKNRKDKVIKAATLGNLEKITGLQNIWNSFKGSFKHFKASLFRESPKVDLI